jgi:hypothetical protein
MNGYAFTHSGAALIARASGCLHWPERALLVVSDLHLGKSDRASRRLGLMLPPYDGIDTLMRLDAEVAATAPDQVICLGDSFDDLAAGAALDDDTRLLLLRLQAGRRWIWIEGNHDPGPVDLGGTHLAELAVGPLSFRHIAQPGARAEVSGHYHPKARPARAGGLPARPAFLIDADRIVMPAFGTYTGGLAAGAAPLAGLMRPDALAVMTGRRAVPVPLSGCAAR